jgi:murein DD-endopeptidase MepM/ murein hydrolase activator NlpD
MTQVWAASALLLTGGFAVAVSVPAEAVLVAADQRGHQGVNPGVQEVDGVPAGAAASTDRDQYEVSEADSLYANTADTFTNDPSSAIQWPFLVGVPITSGFGARSIQGCAACSRFHEGVDFAPGDGTPIRAVAAGVVIKVRADDGGYGNDVWVQHDVGGEQFTSVYGHLQDDSFRVVEGQRVDVGDELGLVGNTGVSTGAHLHLEIQVDGEPVDPILWMNEHTV